MKKIYKYILFGVLTLFLFHFESLSLGPMKISHLWKGFLLIFLIVSLINNNVNYFFIYKPFLWLSFLQLFNLEIGINTFNSILLFGTTLVLPMSGIYVLGLKPNTIKNALLFLATFFILSFVPYKLGLLTSIEDGYDLSKYGGEEGLIGPFQTVHVASMTLAASFLVIVYFWYVKAYNRFFLALLLFLCFYFLIGTYVRAGMAMVLIGLMPFVYYFGRKSSKHLFRITIIGVILSFFIVNWVMQNEILINRIIGVNKHNTEDSFEKFGSGRGGIYKASVEMFAESSLFEKALGMGQTEQKRRMKSKIGYAIIPHNGFLLLLLNNGVLGLILFIVFLFKINRFINRCTIENKVLTKSLFFAYLIMSFVQNYDIFYVFLFLVLSVAYTKNSIREFNWQQLQ